MTLVNDNRKMQRGFSMLELIVVLAVAAIVLAIAAPAVLERVVRERNDETMAQLQAVHAAMVGNQEAGTFGYVGQMGTLPTELNALVERGTQPVYRKGNLNRVGHGWNGPYMNVAAGGTTPFLDRFGSQLIYHNATGQVRSAGPNRIPGDGDDLLYPAQPVNIFGQLVLDVTVIDGDKQYTNPTWCQAMVFYPMNGEEVSMAAPSVPFTFDQVPAGLRAVNVNCSRPTGGTGSASLTAQVMTSGQTTYRRVMIELVRAKNDAAPAGAPATGIGIEGAAPMGGGKIGQ